MKLKKPEREPKREKSYGSYIHDHINVTQEDGSRARFIWNGHLEVDDWKFVAFHDKHGMNIHNELSDKSWSEMILDSAVPEEEEPYEFGYFRDGMYEEMVAFYESEGLVLRTYYYSALLASRGGFFVTSKEDPNTILRSKNILMG
jgi:hypothetical protein